VWFEVKYLLDGYIRDRFHTGVNWGNEFRIEFVKGISPKQANALCVEFAYLQMASELALFVSASGAAAAAWRRWPGQSLP